MSRNCSPPGDAEIVEDSPYDDYWDIGRDGVGKNWAGVIIMEVRDALRKGAPVA